MKLQYKLLIVFVLLNIFIIILAASVMFANIQETLQKKIIEEEHDKIAIEKTRIRSQLDGFTSQTLLIKELPPIQGIIRARKTGIDPMDNSTLEEWKQRLQAIFIGMAKTNPYIYQIKYIDKKGDELVRTNSKDNDISVVPEKELQNKASRYYFQEAMKFDEGEIYVSRLDLNIENGKLEVPYQPVMRFATPVFDKNRARKGIVVINAYMLPILEQIRTPEIGKTILIDNEGYFLHHPDKQKEYSFQLGTGYNYLKEHPELIENLKEADFKQHHNIEEKEFRIWRKIYYNPNNKEDYWVLFSVIKEKDLFAPITALRVYIIYIIILSSLFSVVVVLLIARRITKPLKQLHEGTEVIGRGNLDYKLNIKTKDEIQQLSEAFNKMAKDLKGSQKTVKRYTVGLEKEVKEKTKELQDKLDELESFSKMSIGRELKMIELKKRIKELEAMLKRK